MFSSIRSALSPEAAQALRAAPFVVFLLLGLAVAGAREPRTRRRWIDALLAILLLGYVLVAATQVDAWPFSPYRLMAADARDHHALRKMFAFRGVDTNGQEWKLDPSAWSPLYPEDIMGWFELREPGATPAERESVLSFLFLRAEDARRRRAEGRRVGNERLLGPLTAPDMHIPPPAEGFPPQPFSALRVYRFSWRADDLAGDRSRVVRQLLFEYPRR